MNVTDYRTTADMAAAHPLLQGQAIQFRVTRLLEGDEAARERLGPDRAALVDQWHHLQALEGQGLRAVA